VKHIETSQTESIIPLVSKNHLCFNGSM